MDAESKVVLNGTTMDNSIHWKTGRHDIIHSKGGLDIKQAEIHVKTTGMNFRWDGIQFD